MMIEVSKVNTSYGFDGFDDFSMKIFFDSFSKKQNNNNKIASS